MSSLPFSFSPLPGRPPLPLPGGARVAVYVLVNVEHFIPGQPALSLHGGTAALPVDPLNYGWRDYGMRVGIWRVMKLLEKHGFPVSAALNADVCALYPEVIAAGVERDWAWLGHGLNNSTKHAGMSEDEERSVLAGICETLTSATGRAPKGWIGPSLTETVNTPRLLRELGFSYVLDWGNDDQPYRLDAPQPMVAVPYPAELHDIPLLLLQGMTANEFADAMIEQFDVLYEEAGEGATGAVLGIGVHPFLLGQPYRIRSLERILAHVRSHADVWVTTSDAIADWYLEATAEGQA